METLRFLMVTTHYPPSHLGGDAVLVEYLCRELRRRGHEVSVFHNPSVYGVIRGPSARPSATPPESSPALREYSTRTPRFDLLATLLLGTSAKVRRQLSDQVRKEKPDVVHWHNTRGFIAQPYDVGCGVNLYTAHDYSAVCPRSTLLRPDLTLCEEARFCTLCCLRWKKPPQLCRMDGKRIFKLHQGFNILSPSDFVARRLESEGLKIHSVLRNCAQDLASSAKGNAGTGRTLVYLGMIEEHKGVRLLVEAFARSRNQHDFELRIIGEGSQRPALTKIVHDLGLEDRIALLGFLKRDDAEAIRANAVAQVVPSAWYENAPLTVLEAFSLGLPVISSDIGGLPEMVTPEAGSVVFRAGDAGDLARKLMEIWNDRDNLATRKRKARESYEKNYTPEVHAINYLEIIKSLSR